MSKQDDKEVIEGMENLNVNEENKQQPADDKDDGEGVKPSLNRGGVVHPESWGGWSTSDWQCIKVRGANYLQDKIKIKARAPVFYLEALELFNTQASLKNIAAQKGSYVDRTFKARQAAMEKLRQTSPESIKQFPNLYEGKDAKIGLCTDGGDKLRIYDPDFVFVVNFLVPGNPPYNLTAYFSRSKLDVEKEEFVQCNDQVVDMEDDVNFAQCLEQFVKGCNKYRDNKFKIIPVVVDGGNWIVRKAVGNRPAILGNKLAQTYALDVDKNYFEIDVDCASSKIGATILKLSKNYSKSLTVDMTFLIEGQSKQELPERIFGGIRCVKLDLDKTVKLGSNV